MKDPERREVARAVNDLTEAVAITDEAATATYIELARDRLADLLE